MSAEAFTIFDLATRAEVRCVTCLKEKLREFVKEGQIAVPGRHRGMRLNDANEPEADAERDAAALRRSRRSARMAQIEELERKTLRRLREVLAAQDPQLKAIDDQIAALRADLQD